LFEGAALAKSKGGAVTTTVLTNEDLDVTPTGAWGDDDLGLDDDENPVEKGESAEVGEEGKFYLFSSFLLNPLSFFVLL